ncbi:MAG: AAA family ATPase, partial [Chromatiales bacterium]|nr:AAA family ATPase [Chromatiales bacterium]
MRIIGVYNIKGGVGKTATAVNLAYLSAREGYKTLVWDLDPQAAATYYFRVKPRVKGGGKKMLSGKRDLDDLIKGSDFENLDLLPADFSYRNMDLMLGEASKPAKQLLKLLRPL